MRKAVKRQRAQQKAYEAAEEKAKARLEARTQVINEFDVSTTTFWVTFSDLQASADKRFLGVVIMDLPKDATVIDAVRQAWKLGINPGGACAMYEVERDIPAEHKNRLITDDALLISLGSRGRAMPH